MITKEQYRKGEYCKGMCRFCDKVKECYQGQIEMNISSQENNKKEI